MRVIQLTNKTFRPSPLLFAVAARVLQTLVLFVLSSLASSAYAKDYKVELILFEHNTPARATERHDYQAPQEIRSGSEPWLIEPSMLLDEAKTLSESNDYSVRYHLAWGQESLPYEDSTTYKVSELDASGYIKIYADQLLFANIDLDFDGYRMQEKRRLKLDEKHFFDHPKFGLLLQVSRLEPTPE